MRVYDFFRGILVGQVEGIVSQRRPGSYFSNHPEILPYTFYDVTERNGRGKRVFRGWVEGGSSLPHKGDSVEISYFRLVPRMRLGNERFVKVRHIEGIVSQSSEVA